MKRYRTRRICASEFTISTQEIVNELMSKNFGYNYKNTESYFRMDLGNSFKFKLKKYKDNNHWYVYFDTAYGETKLMDEAVIFDDRDWKYLLTTISQVANDPELQNILVSLFLYNDLGAEHTANKIYTLTNFDGQNTVEFNFRNDTATIIHPDGTSGRIYHDIPNSLFHLGIVF